MTTFRKVVVRVRLNAAELSPAGSDFLREQLRFLLFEFRQVHVWQASYVLREKVRKLVPGHVTKTLQCKVTSLSTPVCSIFTQGRLLRRFEKLSNSSVGPLCFSAFN